MQKTSFPIQYPRTIATTARKAHAPKEIPFAALSATTATNAASPNTPPIILSIYFPEIAENSLRMNDGRSDRGAAIPDRATRSAIDLRHTLAGQPG